MVSVGNLYALCTNRTVNHNMLDVMVLGIIGYIKYIKIGFKYLYKYNLAFYLVFNSVKNL